MEPLFWKIQLLDGFLLANTPDESHRLHSSPKMCSFNLLLLLSPSSMCFKPDIYIFSKRTDWKHFSFKDLTRNHASLRKLPTFNYYEGLVSGSFLCLQRQIPSGNSIINVITGSFLNKTNFQPTLNFAISVYEELRFFVNIIYKQQHLSRRLTTIGEMKINWKKWSVRLRYT